MSRSRFAIACVGIVIGLTSCFGCSRGDAPDCIVPESAQLFDRAAQNLLITGTPLRWDDHHVESPMVIQDGNTYYMYYHAVAWRQGSYRVGLASAPSPPTMAS